MYSFLQWSCFSFSFHILIAMKHNNNEITFFGIYLKIMVKWNESFMRIWIEFSSVEVHQKQQEKSFFALKLTALKRWKIWRKAAKTILKHFHWWMKIVFFGTLVFSCTMNIILFYQFTVQWSHCYVKDSLLVCGNANNYRFTVIITPINPPCCSNCILYLVIHRVMKFSVLSSSNTKFQVSSSRLFLCFHEKMLKNSST